MKKIVVSCGIGNALEWYDFVIYGYFVHVMGELFFPQVSDYAQVIMVFSAFAAGFIARPIGAIVFGKIGDNTSRKKALAVSMYVMAIPTTLIGCLPTFEQVGIWAPILLTALRILQGLAIGGEFTGSMIFLIEHAPEGKKGVYGSVATFSAVLGVILGSAIASIVAYLCSDAQLYEYGWRIPFLISVIGGAVGGYVRKSLVDPQSYLENNQKKPTTKLSVLKIIKNYKSKLLDVILIDFLTAVGFFTVVVFISNYFQEYTGLGDSAHYVNTINMIIFAMSTIIGGHLTDRYSPKRVMFFPCISFIVASYGLFELIRYDQNSLFLPMAAHAVMSIMMGLFFGAIPLAITSLFPVNVRFLCISISHNISMAVFGGTTPLVATFLLEQTHNLSSPAFLLMTAGLLSLIGILRLRFNNKKPTADLLVNGVGLSKAHN